MGEGEDNRRVFSSYGIPWVVIQRVQYLGKYVFIIDAKWSEPIKGYNIKDGQYFLKQSGRKRAKENLSADSKSPRMKGSRTQINLQNLEGGCHREM